jgi:hypothetical protein
MKGRCLPSLSRRSVVPFKFNSKGRHHIPRQRHLVTKWRDFDTALRNRGTSTIWFTEEALADWKAQPRSTFRDALRKPCFCKDGLFDELKKALAERILNAKLDDHFDGKATAGKANHRNRHSKKSALTETSKIDLTIPRSWRRNWEQVIPSFAFPDEVWRIIHTTDEIEYLNARLRRAARTTSPSPSPVSR